MMQQMGRSFVHRDRFSHTKDCRISPMSGGECASGHKRPYGEIAAAAAAAAVAAAAAEELPLIRSDNKAGFKGVAIAPSNKSRPFVVLKAGSKRQYLGYFLTAEEAALAYSRHIGKAAALRMEEEEASKESYLPMSEAEVDQAAAREGLRLLEDPSSSTGYRGVTALSDCPRRPFAARSQRVDADGVRGRWLGYFATKQEAALAYARHLGSDWFEAEAAKAAKAAEVVEAAKIAKAARAEAKSAREAAKAASDSTGESSSAASTATAEARMKEQSREAAAAERKEAAAQVKADKADAQRAAKAVAKAQREEWKRLQAEQEKLKAQHQRKMLQEAAERQRQRAAASSEAQTEAGPLPNGAAALFSSDQPVDAIIEAVLAAPGVCPYVRLGVSPHAPRDACRKSYLQLALKLHPDKCAHPRAKEAFAAVEAAFRTIDVG